MFSSICEQVSFDVNQRVKRRISLHGVLSPTVRREKHNIFNCVSGCIKRSEKDMKYDSSCQRHVIRVMSNMTEKLMNATILNHFTSEQMFVRVVLE